MQFNHCWGCGPNNELGLGIKSVWDGSEAIATFQPQPHHMAGPETILNGGIIATLLDCHCINAAIAHEYHLEARRIGSLPIIWYATGSLSIDYLKPTPINETVELKAKVVSTGKRKKVVSGSIISHGSPCAQARVVAVRVPSDWAKIS